MYNKLKGAIMKKRFAYILIIFFMFVFIFSFYKYLTIHKFNHSAVINNITYLSSTNFKGRMGGTLENDEAASYIKSQFKASSIKEYSNNYYQNFKADYPKRIPGEPYLKVVNGHGETIKTYVYNKDFKEDMLNFKKNHFVFYKSSNVMSQNSFLQITSGKDHYIIYSTKDNKINFRSSFMSNSPYSLCIMATQSCLNEIKNYVKNNCIIDCFIPYTTDTTILKNVISYIPGRDKSKPPIIISAHFDHVGTDLSGNVYQGALDNASGVSFIIEMSKYIHSLGTPDRNIIFAAFNGEEFGLKGSEAFVNSYYSNLKGGEDYNFDMIGSSPSMPLTIMGGKKDSSKNSLINSISTVCAKQNIHFNYLFEDASDHASFRNKNINAVTFCNNDTSRIHTPLDTVSHINTDSIDRCFDVASSEIVNSAYNNSSIFILYNKQICVLSLFAIAALILVLLQDKIFKQKLKNVN